MRVMRDVWKDSQRDTYQIDTRQIIYIYLYVIHRQNLDNKTGRQTNTRYLERWIDRLLDKYCINCKHRQIDGLINIRQKDRQINRWPDRLTDGQIGAGKKQGKQQRLKRKPLVNRLQKRQNVMSPHKYELCK